MIDEAERQFGKLDILCNVAGINDLCYPLAETSDERWDRVLDLDLKAPFQICRRAIKGMVERGSGVILNVASYAALRGNHGPSYTAAKAGLVGLSQSIAVYYARSGIRCNVINPGGGENPDRDRFGRGVSSARHPDVAGYRGEIAGAMDLRG